MELNLIEDEVKEHTKSTNSPEVSKRLKSKEGRPKKTIDKRKRKKCPDCFADFSSISEVYLHAAKSHYLEKIVTALSDEFKQVFNFNFFKYENL